MPASPHNKLQVQVQVQVLRRRFARPWWFAALGGVAVPGVWVPEARWNPRRGLKATKSQLSPGPHAISQRFSRCAPPPPLPRVLGLRSPGSTWQFP